ncbi:rRNA maturation RNase YbeY [bacterium]|nr:rRNA maturation RNase YbeY [bacterium]
MAKNNQCHLLTTIDQHDLPTHRRIRPSLIRETTRQALRLSEQTGSFEVNVIITDDEHIRCLNRNFRQTDSATDVLSFPILDDGTVPVSYPSEHILLGDIVVSAETAARQAAADGVTLEQMAVWLISHGMLHLLGVNHDTEEMRLEMNKREQSILRAMGIPIKVAKLYA